jgi:cytidine deaminase
MMRLDQTLVNAAVDLLEKRFPATKGAAAALYVEDGTILVSVFFQPRLGSAGLCAETGAICEAHKLNKRVTASVCVARLSGADPILVNTPCGICQERLFYWGEQVEVGTPDPVNATHWVTKTLNQVQPHYWVNAYYDRPIR